MKSPGEYVDIGDQPCESEQTRMEHRGLCNDTGGCLWKEDIKNYIMDEIIKMCKEHGITDLYVLNRDFILSAIREKMEREAQL